MSDEGERAGPAFGVSGVLPLPSWGRWVSRPGALYSSARGPRMRPCVITARILGSTCHNARGLGAGAVIAVLRGLRADRRQHA